MKTFIWIIILGIIFLFFFRFIRKILFIRKTIKEALNQGQHFNQQNYNTNSNNKNNTDNYTEKPKYNIEAETVDFEIIEENKNEKK